MAGVQIEEARSKLVGEFDKPQRDAVAKLARLYVRLGFGAEARAVLHALPVEMPDSDLIETMAEIVDNGSAVTPGRLAGQANCKGAAALWSVLASPHLPVGTVVNTDAVIQSFSGLPLALRELLGPGLADRFLARNDTDTARALRDTITRAVANPGPELRLVSARLDIARGAVSEGTATIETVVKSDGAELAGRHPAARRRANRARRAGADRHGRTDRGAGT